MLQELGRLEEAEVNCKKAIALKPNFEEAHFNLGIAFQEQGRFEEAVTSYKQTIVFRPDYAKAQQSGYYASRTRKVRTSGGKL